MSPESAVKTWWNALTPTQRREEASNLLDVKDLQHEWDDWSVPWNELLPIGQQMKLHMYFDGALQGKRRLNP